MKELVSIRPLLQKAKDELRALAASEIRLRENHDEIVRRAWTLGSYLCELKENVGRGNWQIWLPANLPDLGSTDRARQANAARCIRFYRDNPNCRNSCNYTPESKRKLMWGYVPAKERLQLPGDEKVKPEAHHLTFVNCFSKYDHQLRSGRVGGFDIDLFRRETEPMIRRLIDLCGAEWVSKLCS
jgi:hypothetical protein